MSFRIVFMGTPDFAVPALKKIIASQHTVEAVYCRAPKPKGRGHRTQLSPVHQVAEDAGIPVFTPKTFKQNPDAIEQLKSLNPDVIVVVAYGLILPKAVLDIPPRGCINIHGSLLPRWRGAAPIHRALLAGDKVTGITTMFMDEGLDTGQMLLKAEVAIKPDHTISMLHDELSELGAELILETLDKLDTIIPETQPEEGVTYAHKLTNDEGVICWDEPAEVIERQMRALNPWPGTYTYYKGQKVKLLSATCVEASGQPGHILDDRLLVACGQNAVRILSLQRQGARAMDAKDFLNGFPIKAGECFSTCPDTN